MPKRGVLDPEAGEEVGSLLMQKGLTEEELMKMFRNRQRKSVSGMLSPRIGGMAAPGILSQQ